MAATRLSLIGSQETRASTDSIFGRIFYGKPAATFPENALCGAEPVRLRRKIDRPQRGIADVLERHGHHLAGAVDRHVAEELQAEARRQVGLVGWRRLLKLHLRAERVVEVARPPGAGMDRPGDEFP